MTWFAFILAVATAVAYSVLFRAQSVSGLDILTVPFVTAYILLMGALLGASMMRRWQAGVRMPLRASASGGLLVLGILAIFSIGLPLVVAGAMATGATVRSLRRPHVTSSSIAAVVGAAVAVVVLVVGFEVSERVIACPAHGTAGGGGSGLISGPYHYECVNGVLSFHTGSCAGSTIDLGGNTTSNTC